MPKRSRRRLITPSKNKTVDNTYYDEIEAIGPIGITDKEIYMARGRLKGVLKEVCDTGGDDSDETSAEGSSVKQERFNCEKMKEGDEFDDEIQKRQSYVLKLFDRSVDLSQFREDSPLYPICRAWIHNQPKANYEKLARASSIEPQWNDKEGILLPGPKGSPVTRIPELLPEQKACSKNNINLNYREAPPPSKWQLLQQHGARWTAVRAAWQQQAARAELRYSDTQDVLNKLNVNGF